MQFKIDKKEIPWKKNEFAMNPLLNLCLWLDLIANNIRKSKSRNGSGIIVSMLKLEQFKTSNDGQIFILCTPPL